MTPGTFVQLYRNNINAMLDQITAVANLTVVGADMGWDAEVLGAAISPGGDMSAEQFNAGKAAMDQMLGTMPTLRALLQPMRI